MSFMTIKRCANCDKQITPFISSYKTIKGVTLCNKCYIEAKKVALKNKAFEVLKEIEKGDITDGRN